MGVKTDRLSEEEIRRALKKDYREARVCVYESLDSTSQEAKRLALEGAEHGLVVLAEAQTAGKGRRGRSFFSPAGTGIYMSILFRPAQEQSENVVLVTTAASVAVCRAIRRILKEEPEIKWVNDVYFHGKKICGILTEAVSDFANGGIHTVVVGIGINYYIPKDDFPAEIQEIAGAVCGEDKKVSRNILAAEVINELRGLYDHLEERTYLKDYRRWSNVLGKEVRFSSSVLLSPGERPSPEQEWSYGKAVDIDDDGGLVVLCKDGRKQVLRTGEITVRVI